jgi:uncharacterized protein (DUF433 family)
MTVTDRIEINPKIMLGKPVIRGTRITVELILRKFGEGAREADLLDAYPGLTTEDIRGQWLTRRTPLRTKKPSFWSLLVKHRTVNGCDSSPMKAAILPLFVPYVPQATTLRQSQM